MKQISIRVPDTQVPFMLELLNKFDFVKIDMPDNEVFQLSPAQKEYVEIECEKSKENPDYLLDWVTVKDTLKID